MNKYQDALYTLRTDFEEFVVKPNDIGRFFKHSEADELIQEAVDKVENLEEENKKLKTAIEILKPISQVDTLKLGSEEGYFIACMSSLTKEQYDQLKEVFE